MKTFDLHHESLAAEIVDASRLTLVALSILAFACAGAIGLMVALAR